MSSKLAALLKAVAEGNITAVKREINAGNCNFRDPADGVTLLARAVSENYYDIAELLLQTGASLEVTDNVGFAPMHRAAWTGSIAMCKLLVKHGANIDCAVEGHYAACAAAPRDLSSASKLSSERKTPLILAAMRGDVDLVSLLCEHGANIDARDAYNMSAMDHAALEGRDEVVTFLLERGCDANAARVLSEYGAEHSAMTLPQRGAYNDIAKTLCAVWAPQCQVTVV